MFVIVKGSLTPKPVSDGGKMWDDAGLRSEYQPVYKDGAKARKLARILSEIVGVGVYAVPALSDETVG